jgi:hypothetical protein
MKKTVTCLAMIASATAFAASKTDAKKDAREPAASPYQGYTYAGCQPRGLYTGDEAYKNACIVPLKEIEVPAGGMTPPGSKVKVLGCDDRHVLVVSSYPIRFVCLPPGAVEL